MSYLLGVTLGPVQLFIQDSEKLRDLNNSSRIISDLMKKIIDYVLDEDKSSKLIYPRQSAEDCSNYLVFEISKKLELSNLETEIYTGLNSEIKEILKEVFHLFWAIVPIEDGNYDSTYVNLQRLIRGMKNTYLIHNKILNKDFKCNVCGKYPKSERDLCLLCHFKRNHKSENKRKSSYKSNYSIAIEVWKKNSEENLADIEKLLEEIFKNNQEKYYSITRVKSIIEVLKSVLEDRKYRLKSKRHREFIEDLGQDYEYGKRLTSTELEVIKEKLKKLEELSKILNGLYKNSISEPNYEYTFIQFDIDSLGKWISGKSIKNKGEDLKEYQKSLSNMIVSFGEKLRKDLDEHCNIIYSGGDDFLAIIPNEIIFEVLEQIDTIFEESILTELKKKQMSQEMTFSSCVTISPCRAPMGEIINKSRIELNNVKQRYKDKNGVVFNYIVGNESSVTVYMKKDKVIQLKYLIEEYKKVKDKISLSFIRKYEKEFLSFNYKGITADEFRDLKLIVKVELERLMKRSIVSCVNEVKSETLDSYINSMYEFINGLYIENHTKKTSDNIDIDFINVINIMVLYERLCRLNWRDC